MTSLYLVTEISQGQWRGWCVHVQELIWGGWYLCSEPLEIKRKLRCNNALNTLPSSCMAFSRAFTVSWFRWRIRDKRPRSHSRPQRPRSFWSALGMATSGKVQISEYAQSNRFVFSANQMVRLDSGHAQSDRKSVDRRLPVLDLPRGRLSWCWLGGARPLEPRMARSSLDSNVMRMRLDQQQDACWWLWLSLRDFNSWSFLDFYA